MLATRERREGGTCLLQGSRGREGHAYYEGAEGHAYCKGAEGGRDIFAMRQRRGVLAALAALRARYKRGVGVAVLATYNSIILPKGIMVKSPTAKIDLSGKALYYNPLGRNNTRIAATNSERILTMSDFVG
jgi:hypothetical protein